MRRSRALELARAVRAQLSAGRGALRACSLAAVALVALPGALQAQEAPAVPAAEGAALLDALASAPLALVGTVRDRRALDEQAWRAELEVESALVGEKPAGARVAFAWEELARSRPPRFAAGDRVLVALEPLPPASLWAARIPEPAERARVSGVAQDGNAFLRSPSLGSLATLQHYLALPPEARRGPDGARHLLALVEQGERALALSAATSLAGAQLGAPVPGPVAGLALRALARAEGDPELEAPLLTWLRASQPDLAAALDAALAESKAPPSIWYRARAVLAGGLAPSRTKLLLASPSVRHRLAGVEAAGASDAARVAQLAKDDAAPEVRAAAVERVAQLGGAAALEDVLAVFSDRDVSVRAAAAQAAARSGVAAVPRLREVAQRWPAPAPTSAVLALRLVGGADATAALRELAETHPDERVRFLANAALGKPLGHAH